MPIRTTLIVEDEDRRIGWDQVILNRIGLTQVGLFSAAYLFDIGTSEGTLAFGDIVPGKIILANLDGTNFVEWGFATTVRPARLAAKSSTDDQCGDPTTIRIASGTTIYIKADTAACQVRAWAFME